MGVQLTSSPGGAAVKNVQDFFGEHMLQAALGVKTELFPEWGK